MTTSRVTSFRVSKVALLVITLCLVAISVPTAAPAQDQEPNGRPSAQPAGEAASVDVPVGDPHSLSNCYAVINANGTAQRRKCVVSNRRLGTGQYEVRFNGSVGTCTFLATLGSVSIGVAATGQITTNTRVGTTNGVFVGTYTSGGAFADRQFHLGVFC